MDPFNHLFLKPSIILTLSSSFTLKLYVFDFMSSAAKYLCFGIRSMFGTCSPSMT